MLIGVTGSIGVYQHELDAALNPQFWRVDTDTRASPGLIAEAVHRQLPDLRSALLVFPTTPREVYRLHGQRRDGDDEVFIEWALHPQTGTILAERSSADGRFARVNLVKSLFALHVDLWLGTIGFTLVGVLGFVLLGSSITGLRLWWPRRGHWRTGLTLKPRASTPRRTFDQHRVGGIYGWLLLVLLSFSGTCFVFGDDYRRFAAHFATVEPFPRRIESTPLTGQPPLSLDAALTIAAERYPRATLTMVNLSIEPTDAYRIRLRQPNEHLPRGQTRVWIDAWRGTVLADTDTVRSPPVNRFLNLMVPLHSGDIAGSIGRVLVCIAGFLPLLLFVTGLRMWRHRTTAHRQARRRRTAVSS